jgi:hypothetical protein
MSAQRSVPENPLTFIKQCIEGKRIFWTYHVNMRLGIRPISRETILGAVDSFEIIEEYPDDKYLPSYLLKAIHGELVFHVQIATDVVLDNIRIVTAYKPDPAKWDREFRTRRKDT